MNRNGGGIFLFAFQSRVESQSSVVLIPLVAIGRETLPQSPSSTPLLKSLLSTSSVQQPTTGSCELTFCMYNACRHVEPVSLYPYSGWIEKKTTVHSLK